MGRVTNTESFIREATLINGDRYDYSKVVYIKSNQKVEIVCRKHGSFWQRAEIHIYGQGCPKCRNGKMGHKRDLIISREMPSDLNIKRKCSKCKKYFDRDCFYKDKDILDGLGSRCKDCENKINDIWRELNAERWDKNNKERNKRKWAEFKEEHKEELEQKRIQRELESVEKKRNAKTARRLRAIIRDAIRSNAPRPHMKELLGCSVSEFRIYLASLFTEGMTWDNNTPTGWHMDHIKPIASFLNLRDDIEEQKECFHYTNYQPLWAKPNMSKGSLYNGVRYGRQH